MTRLQTRLAVALCGLLAGWQPVSAGSQTDTAAAGPPAPSRELRGQLGASVNNLGLQNSVDVIWTWPLSASANPWLSAAHLSAGVSNALTPAQARVGGWVEYSPLSVLDLRVGVDPSVYFGTFHSLLSFDAYGDRFDKDARKARNDASTGTAARAYLAPTFKARAGSVVASIGAELEWWRSSARGPFFYEPTRDTLLRSAGDRMITATTVVMHRRTLGSGGALSVGGLHSLTYVPAAPGNRIQRIGAIGIREFESRRFHLPHPRLTGVLAYYVDDPSKRGQIYAALAVGFRVGG